MRRAAKIDRNQPEIVKALRAVGAKVMPMHFVGNGFPDLLVNYRGKLVLLEVKDGELSTSRKKLTPDERDFFDEFNAPGTVVYVVESVDHAFDVCGVSRNMQALARLPGADERACLGTL